LADFAQYAMANGLALNGQKMQLLVGGKGVSAGDLVNFSITVDGKTVSPASTFELLGVKFDSKFSTAPHDDAVAAKARQRSWYVARLANFIPKGPLLKILADDLVMGYLSHALAAVAAPRLGRRDDPQKKTKWSTTQIAINDSARTIVGAKRSNCLSVHGLLARAKVDFVNAHIVQAVETETWTAFHSSDGDGRERNPLGVAMFGCSQVDTDGGRSSRAKTAGEVPVNLRGSDCLVQHGAHLWNLRRAETRGKAKSVARKLAAAAPV
jgi:hypothetical protein